MLRLWHQSMTEDGAMEEYRSTLEAHAAVVCAEAPVLDSFAVAWHHAAMLVGLWRRTATRVARTEEYAAPRSAVTAEFYPLRTTIGGE